MSQSSVDFIHNYGIRGGAIALIGESAMIIGPNRMYRFISNRAVDRGGAVYVQTFDNHDITASKTCFIQYHSSSTYIPIREWNVSILFRGNRANAGTGHAIFSTSLHSCQIINIGELHDIILESINISYVFTARGITIKEDPTVEGHQVATDGAKLHYRKHYEVRVIPGEQFAHGVSIVDDLDNQAKVVLTASVQNNNDNNVRLASAFTACIGEQIVLKGKPGEIANLVLHTASSRLSYIKLRMKLVDCPPGFIYSDASSGCICISHEYTGLLLCNTTLFYSYISPGFWIGILNDNKNDSKPELVTSYCPLNFCNYDDTNTSES